MQGKGGGFAFMKTKLALRRPMRVAEESGGTVSLLTYASCLCLCCCPYSTAQQSVRLNVTSMKINVSLCCTQHQKPRGSGVVVMNGLQLNPIYCISSSRGWIFKTQKWERNFAPCLNDKLNVCDYEMD